MKHPGDTGSVSSFKSWTSTDPSPYSQTAFHSGISQQQQSSFTPYPVNPPRGSSTSYSATRNRSNSNGSNLSSSQNYSFNYSGSHMSHVSQHSNASSYAHAPVHYPSQYQQQQQQQQQQWQYQGYNDNVPNQPLNSNNASFDMSGAQGFNSFNNNGSENHMADYQQQQQQNQGYPQRQQYRPTPSDVSISSVSHSFHQEALTSSPPSQEVAQLMDQINPQNSSRVTQRLAQKRRDPTSSNLQNSEESNLPSLDQYEEMLQKMTSPSLGPTILPETRTGLRRPEHAPRQTRRQQQQQQQPQQQYLEPMLEPIPISTATLPQNEQVSNGLLSPEVRKLRRRSSLPMSFGEAPKSVPTSAMKRSSGIQNSSLETKPSQDQNLTVTQKDERHSWEDDNIEPRRDLIYGINQPQSKTPVIKKYLLHADEDDDSRSTSSLADDPEKQQRQQSQRDSGIKPPLSMKSQLRLSQTPSQSDAEEISMLVVDDEQDVRFTGSPRIEEGDRQSEGYFRNGAGSPRNQPFTSTRSRATTPLGMVSEETTVSFSGTPNRQQLLASMDNGPSTMPSPNRSTPPNSSRSRPTTPVSGIRPPPGPAPMPMVSAPISIGAQSSPTGNPRKGSPAGRRIKPNPSVSSPILHPMMPRPRAGSIASVSSMTSISGIAMDSVLQQAPPSLPLPSIPPPSSSGSSSEIISQRRRKPSGGRDLVLPTAQLLAEGIAASRMGQDSLPTPASSLPISPELGAASLSPPGGSPQPHQAHISRLKKRVSSLEKELESLGKELSSRVKNGGELQFRVEQLTVERDALEKQVSILQDFAFKDRKGNDNDDDLELKQALKQIQDDRDERLRECLSRQEDAKSDISFSDAELLKIQAERSELKKEAAESKNEIQRLRSQLLEREQDASREQKVREELELKMEALRSLQESGGNSTLQQELEVLKTERLGHQENSTSLQEELEALTSRLQQEEFQYRLLQDNVQRLTSRLEHAESQHESEIQQIQRDHEEVLEKVVIEHANALMTLSEQSKTDSEMGFRKERKEYLVREKVLNERLKEQTARNDALEEKLIQQERSQQLLEEDREGWAMTKKSLERQLEMERLERQESAYKMEQVEKENRRLRSILSDLDLVALLSLDRQDADAGDDHAGLNSSKEMLKLMYESQRQRWMDQVHKLERKMAKAEEATAEILQKNMELMVALDMAQSPVK
ncbi:hypothetical protein BGZ49_005028 [Haplosporangium sp. Z 27]|nr:hypothetical protein BGZ49_005028 [Haplosporangium sp. Z 27]